MAGNPDTHELFQGERLLGSGQEFQVSFLKSNGAYMRVRRVFSVLVFLLCAASIAWCEDPLDATVCGLKNDPLTYNHKLVTVTGFVSHGFEDFTLFDPNCSSWPGIWLEYGGKSKSGTMYCCGVTADRSRPKELSVEHVPIPLVQDELFKSFDRAIQPPFRSGQEGAIIRATLVGRFFAGKQIRYPKATVWGGYGHMGCCTLLAIEQVTSVDTEGRGDLDYGASADQPDIANVGCGYQFLLPFEQTSAQMEWQREADAGKNDWAFDDPQRVASTTLARLAHVDLLALADMNLTRYAQGRKIYEWAPGVPDVKYMIVVSRPYVMSFYSRDPKRVAWTAIAAYKSSCGKNSVTRIK